MHSTESRYTIGESVSHSYATSDLFRSSTSAPTFSDTDHRGADLESCGASVEREAPATDHHGESDAIRNGPDEAVAGMPG